MLQEAISANLGCLFFKIFWGSMPPDPPRRHKNNFFLGFHVSHSFLWLKLDRSDILMNIFFGATFFRVTLSMSQLVKPRLRFAIQLNSRISSTKLKWGRRPGLQLLNTKIVFPVRKMSLGRWPEEDGFRTSDQIPKAWPRISEGDFDLPLCIWYRLGLWS